MEDSLISAIKNLKLQLPKSPALARWVSIADLGDHRLQFRGNDFVFTLNHQLFTEAFLSIRQFLDGNHSLEEIISSGNGSFRPTTIEFLLKTLCANGLLHDRGQTDEISPDLLASLESKINFFSRFTAKPVEALGKIINANIGLLRTSRLGDQIKNQLPECGFSPLTEFENTSEILSREDSINLDFLIVEKDSYDFTFFKEVNDFCLSQGLRWICVAVEGDKALLGPTVIPFQGPCFNCFLTRKESHTGDTEEFIPPNKNGFKQPDSKKFGTLSPVESKVASEVALELARFISGYAPPQTVGINFEFNCESPVPDKHKILRIPRCSSCHKTNPMSSKWTQ